jgi:hypothetical protein
VAGGSKAHTRFVFVGERRSPTAIRMGVTWKDGRLCAKNLHEALRCCGIEPLEQEFVNAWRDDGDLDGDRLEYLEQAAKQGRTVVALGKRVRRLLMRRGIAHVSMIHPAARGAIRLAASYRAHVSATLRGERP